VLVCEMRDLRASGSCVSCWGRTSHVRLGEYILQLQAARAAGGAWQTLFPAAVELEMSESLAADAPHHVPVVATAQRDDMLAASVRCGVRIDGVRTDVPREHWRCFRVSDAGMNYDQARQINRPNAIAKIHEAAVMREHCWVHADEVARARQMPNGALRCLACRVPFDAQTVDLLPAAPLERLMQHVRAHDAAAAARVLRGLDPAMFDGWPEGLWALLSEASAGINMSAMGLLCRHFPLALQWPGYSHAVYGYASDPELRSADLLRLLEQGGLCMPGGLGAPNVLGYMIRSHVAQPERLIKKMRIVLEHHAALDLNFAHVRNCVDTYAELSRDFEDREFLAGFNLLLEYANVVRTDHEFRGSCRDIMYDDMISGAALRNDVRLLAYLYETHALDIHKVYEHNENAYSFTSSSAVVRYLWAKGVDPHLISTEGGTPLTALLRRVLQSTAEIPVRDVYECVHFYFVHGEQLTLLDGTDAAMTRQICEGFRLKDPAVALQAFYENPLHLAERVVDKWHTHYKMHRLVQYVHMHKCMPLSEADQTRLPLSAADPTRLPLSAADPTRMPVTLPVADEHGVPVPGAGQKRMPAPRAAARKFAPLAAQHIVGAPRAVHRLPALVPRARAGWLMPK